MNVNVNVKSIVVFHSASLLAELLGRLNLEVAEEGLLVLGAGEIRLGA